MGVFKNKYLFFILASSLLNFNILYSDEKVDDIINQIKIISQDLKTLEKAFYKNSDIIDKNKTSNINNLNEDALTKHLLRLNEIEEQFRELTNQFEEVNFKIRKICYHLIARIKSRGQDQLISQSKILCFCAILIHYC